MAAILAITPYLLFSTSWRALSDTVLRHEYSVGQFQHATRLAVSPQGWIYSIDEAANVIHVLKSRGQDSFGIGGFGWSATSFDKPTGIATDGINVFVSDYGNHRIQRFDKNLNYISTLSTRDTTVVGARFGYPMSVAVSKSGDLFVLDSENLRVVRFSVDSKYLHSFGSFDAGKGKLVQPGKIVISNDGRIYISEPSRIVEFDYFGNFVKTIGNGILNGVRTCEATEQGVLAASKETLFWFSKAGVLTLRTPIQSLLADEPLSDVQDIVLLQNIIYVLSEKRIFVFTILTM